MKDYRVSLSNSVKCNVKADSFYFSVNTIPSLDIRHEYLCFVLNGVEVFRVSKFDVVEVVELRFFTPEKIVYSSGDRVDLTIFNLELPYPSEELAEEPEEEGGF